MTTHPFSKHKNAASELSSIPNIDRRTFAAMTIYLDLVVANITSILTEKGMWDETIFIYASDNGGDSAAVGSGNNMPLRGRKSNYFEGGVRVPAFIYSKLLPSSCSVSISSNLLSHSLHVFRFSVSVVMISVSPISYHMTYKPSPQRAPLTAT